MPEIRLEQQKNNITVLADGEPVLHTTPAILRQTGIRSGDLLTQEELDRFLSACTERMMQKKAGSLLSRQSMSRKTLTRKLGGNQTAEEVADQLEAAGYLNDADYAAGRADLLIHRRLHAPSRAEHELIAEGIDPKVAKSAVDETHCDPCKNIEKLLESRYRSKLTGPDGLRKTIGALLRAGYRMEDIRTVLGTQMVQECEEEFSWESE